MDINDMKYEDPFDPHKIYCNLVVEKKFGRRNERFQHDKGKTILITIFVQLSNLIFFFDRAIWKFMVGAMQKIKTISVLWMKKMEM